MISLILLSRRFTTSIPAIYKRNDLASGLVRHVESIPNILVKDAVVYADKRGASLALTVGPHGSEADVAQAIKECIDYDLKRINAATLGG